MDTKQKTLRITEFKGLNKSANPHNIDDAEFSEMVNLELNENQALQSRMGFTKVIDHIDPLVLAVKGIYKADWDDYTSTLYTARSWGICKNNETTGEEAWVGVLPNPLQKPVQFQRWHDKLLMLAQGESLMWMDNTESLNTAAYPQFKRDNTFTSSLSLSAGGVLTQDTLYQYNVSFVLGDDCRGGETAGALPADPRWYLPVNYAGIFTTAANKTITSNSTFSFTGGLNGFTVRQVKLFRRTTAYVSNIPSDPATPWVLIGSAYIKKVGADYSFDYGVGAVITSLSGTYTSATDTAQISIIFTDDGTVDYDAGQSPMPHEYLAIPKAKFMARLSNRVYLGNIAGNDPRDKKTVRYTYIGRIGPSGSLDEIPNFNYGFPMLAFGPYSWFYCDHEDTDDEITGMYGYRNSLIIYTGKCTFMWQEGMSDPVKISNDVGCIAPETIREFEGYLIWLSANGIVMYDGSKLKNLSADKVNSCILGLSKDYAYKACAAIFNRRYYISAPFGGGVANDTVLVYDFDVKEWTERVYKIGDSATHFYIDCFYKYSDGAKETLYTGGHSDEATPLCYIVKLDEGYSDGGAAIHCSLKMKYYDFGAPDIVKDIRAFNIDMSNRDTSTLTMDMYLDNLSKAAYTFSYSGITEGFVLDDADHGRLDLDSIVDITDDMFAFSLPIGQHGSRFQFGIDFDAGSVQTLIHAISIDWRAIRKLPRKYGG